MKASRMAFLSVLTIALAIVIFSLPAAAQVGTNVAYPSGNTFQFDFRISYFDYKEDLPAPLKSTESGWLPGFVIGWTRAKPGAVYARTFLELSSGDVEYDGTTQTGRPITYSGSNQLLFRVEGNIGYTLGLGSLLVSPYTGYGYRYWKRGDSDVVDSVAFVREDYEWMYIPVGLRAIIPAGERVSIEPNGGARFMFWGRMTAYLSDFGYSSDPTFDLGNKPGYFVEIPIRYRMDRGWSLVLTPFYEYSAIGQSDIESVRRGPFIDSFYEPSSRTHQFGINIGAGFSF